MRSRAGTSLTALLAALVVVPVGLSTVGLPTMGLPTMGLGVATAPAAAAASDTARVPGRPVFPALIDAFPRYEAEDSCSAKAKPGAVTLQNILRVTYGSSIRSNIVRGCTSRASGHEEGRAIDWMVSQRNPAQKAMGDAFVSWLLAKDAYGNPRAMGRRLGVQYVIWKSRIIMLTGPDTAWREYSNCLTKRTKKADDTYCHRDHVHLSLTWAGARQKSTWYTLANLPACAKAPAGTLPASSGRAASTVTVPKTGPTTPVLDTTLGIGTPQLAVPCRLPSDAGLRVRTAGVGGVPASGVAEVLLKVRATAAGLPTEVYPRDPVVGAAQGGSASGVRRSDGPVRPGLTLEPGRTGSASWWVRVDAKGDAAVLVGHAVQRLEVSVAGYRLAAAGQPSGGTGSPVATVDPRSRNLP